ncbi:peptidylprolyl isomerase [Actibacterium sp. D379-3]
MPNLMKPLLAATLAIGLSVPVWAAEPTAETVVATVGGSDITLGQMIVMTAQLPQDYQTLPDEILYQAVLDQLIRQIAVGQTIENDLSKEAQLALANERISFLASEALNRVAADAVSDEAIQQAYDAKYADAASETEFNAAHILVETEEEAKALKAELDAGADFAELAREKSTGPSGPSGGALGWFSKGMMVKPFEDAVLTMQPGDVSGPIQTQFGWHIVKLNETRDMAAPALEEVAPELAGELQQAAIAKAIDEITAQTDVQRSETEIDPALLRNMELLND